MNNSDYLYDYKKLQYMTYLDRIQEFEELSGDHDMAVLLEYFYSSYWTNIGMIDYKDYDYAYQLFVSEIENYYKQLVYSKSGNNTTSKVYSFTNENLEEFFNSSKINVRGKRVLTVGSSGDQAFNAIYHGAKEVDIVDMNIMTKLFIDLKTAMIKNLSFEEFDIYSKGFVDYIEKYYPKISHDLPQETQQFFDTIMLDGCNDWLVNFIRESGLRGATNSVMFKDEEAYYELQDKLIDENNKINVIVGDISQFVDVTKGQYDLILLSNVYEYFAMHASPGVGGKFVEDFYDAIKKLYNNRLANDGLMEITSRDYTYDDKFKEETQHLHNFLATLGGKLVSIERGGMNDGMVDDYPCLLIQKPNENVNKM